MPRTLDDRIVIIDIDEKSLKEEGRWPWGRDRMALLMDKLFDKYGVAVVGFDDVQLASSTDPPLTTVRQHTVEQGRAMAALLVELLSRGTVPAPDDDVPHVVLPVQLVVRESA